MLGEGVKSWKQLKFCCDNDRGFRVNNWEFSFVNNGGFSLQQLKFSCGNYKGFSL